MMCALPRLRAQLAVLDDPGVLESALDDRSPVVRAAAVVGLISRGSADAPSGGCRSRRAESGFRHRAAARPRPCDPASAVRTPRGSPPGVGGDQSSRRAARMRQRDGRTGQRALSRRPGRDAGQSFAAAGRARRAGQDWHAGVDVPGRRAGRSGDAVRGSAAHSSQHQPVHRRPGHPDSVARTAAAGRRERCGSRSCAVSGACAPTLPRIRIDDRILEQTLREALKDALRLKHWHGVIGAATHRRSRGPLRRLASSAVRSAGGRRQRSRLRSSSGFSISDIRPRSSSTSSAVSRAVPIGPRQQYRDHRQRRRQSVESGGSGADRGQHRCAAVPIGRCDLPGASDDRRGSHGRDHRARARPAARDRVTVRRRRGDSPPSVIRSPGSRTMSRPRSGGR